MSHISCSKKPLAKNVTNEEIELFDTLMMGLLIYADK